MKVEITIGSIAELQDLIEIGRTTFYETFAKNNSEDNMMKYLNEGFSEDKVRSQINDPNSIFYLARIDGKIVGYLKMNLAESQTELKDHSSIEIERIYVLNDFHGQKVGQRLYDKALEFAREKEVDYMWLGVWEKNPRAIRFYEKNGFSQFDTHIFRLGDDEQIDIMMKIIL